MEKTKKILIIAAIITIILIVIVVGSYKLHHVKLESPTNQIKQTGQEQTKKLSNVDKEIVASLENCQKDIGQKQYDSSVTLSDYENSIFYFIAQAIADKNIQSCDELSNDQDKNYCFKTLYGITAIAENNDKYCDKIAKINADDGIICLATVKKDSSLCNIKDELKNNICIGSATRDDSICQKLTSNYDSIGACISTNGGSSKDQGVIEDCGQISASEAQSLCKESVEFVKAIVDKNSNECLQTNSTDGLTNLFCQMATVKDPENELNEFYKNNACYEMYASELAKMQNDPSICEKIPQKDSANRVHYQQCKDQFK